MKREFSELSNRVIGCAIEVHRILGPGLLESMYQQRLAHELESGRHRSTLERPLPVEYKGIRSDCGHRIDVLVENEIILEKSGGGSRELGALIPSSSSCPSWY